MTVRTLALAIEPALIATEQADKTVLQGDALEARPALRARGPVSTMLSGAVALFKISAQHSHLCPLLLFRRRGLLAGLLPLLVQLGRLPSGQPHLPALEPG
ncbi:MAG: hypothetical protein AAFP20_19235 [Cyanobacteria bacterium J06614_10]